jgi:hypothetical protein
MLDCIFQPIRRLRRLQCVSRPDHLILPLGRADPGAAGGDRATTGFARAH